MLRVISSHFECLRELRGLRAAPHRHHPPLPASKRFTRDGFFASVATPARFTKRAPCHFVERICRRRLCELFAQLAPPTGNRSCGTPDPARPAEQRRKHACDRFTHRVRLRFRNPTSLVWSATTTGSIQTINVLEQTWCSVDRSIEKHRWWRARVRSSALRATTWENRFQAKRKQTLARILIHRGAVLTYASDRFANSLPLEERG